MEMNEKQQEIIYKLSIFEQQMQQIQQQLQMIEQGIIELNGLSRDIEELKGKKDGEILAPLGRGIYAKAKLLSEEFIVDIGSKNFVKKNIPETKEMIDGQVIKLKEIHEQLLDSMNELSKEAENLLKDAEIN
jgi:prefoldin alpha subunit